MSRVLKFNLKNAKSLLPARKALDHKGSAGKSLIIAGSEGMFGAAILTATAASRVGSGYVFLMTESKKFPSKKAPDFLIFDWKKKKPEAISVAIGPGLGKSMIAKRCVHDLLGSKQDNVVIDADALNICAKNKWLSFPSSWIATPHEGELARLLGLSAEKIRKDRREAVRLAQKRLGCLVLLKGHRTLVATPTKIFEIQSGNAALAKAGTGDVLSGMITGFLAQGLKPVDAACLGAFVHGWISDRWVQSGRDQLSLMASDLLNALPQALSQIRKTKS